MNLLPIDRDFKSAAARRDEGERPKALFEPQEFFRQTDGMRLVVSSRAIIDGDFDCHRCHSVVGQTKGRRRQSSRRARTKPQRREERREKASGKVSASFAPLRFYSVDSDYLRDD